MPHSNFKSETLQSKVVPEIMDLLPEFKNKAIRFEEIHKRYNQLKLQNKSYEEEVEFKELFAEKDTLKQYLEMHIQQFKKNRQEWFFEHIEAQKHYSA